MHSLPRSTSRRGLLLAGVSSIAIAMGSPARQRARSARGVASARRPRRRRSIDPSVLQEEKEVLEGLIAAAINDAVRKVESTSKEKLSSLTAGMQLPEGSGGFGDDKA